MNTASTWNVVPEVAYAKAALVFGFRQLPIYVVFPLLLSVVIEGLSGCQGGLAGPDETIAKARQRVANGDLKGGLIELRELVQRVPENPRVRAELARVDLAMMDIGGAEKEATKAIALGDTTAETQVLLANALFQAGKYEVLRDLAPREGSSALRAEIFALQTEARLEIGDHDGAQETLKVAKSLDLDGVATRMAAARMLAKSNDIDGAIAALKVLVEKFPTHGRGWVVLSRLYEAKGAKEEAIAALKKAIPLLYIASSERYRLAKLLIADGKYDDANPLVKQMLADYGHDSRAQFAAGLLAYGRKEFKAASDRFKKIGENDRVRIPEVDYYDGVVALTLGKNEQAVDRLQHASKSFPTSAEVNHNLALAFLSIGDKSSAEAVLKKFLVQDPQDPETLRLLGQIAISGGKADEGVDYLRKLVAQHRESAPAFLLLGEGLINAGKLDEGLSAFAEAAKLDPKSSGAARTIGTLLANGNITEARAKVNQYLGEQPSAPGAHNLNGLVLNREGKSAEARDAFGKALVLDPTYLPAIYNLALMQIEAGELDAAIERLESATQAHPKDVRLLVMQAESKARQGHLASAKSLLDRALVFAPDDPTANVAMARMLLQQKDFNSAIKHLDLVRQSYPGNAMVLSLLGYAYLETNQPESAVSALAAAAAVFPNDPSVIFALARAYGLKGDRVLVRKALNKTLELNPGYFPARLAMIRYDALDGKILAAKENLVRLAKDYSEEPSVLALQADFAFSEKNYSEAIGKLAAAIKKSPNERDFYLKLADAQLLNKEPKAAIETIQSWLAKFPEDQVGLNALAEKQLASGELATGLTTYRKLLKLNPEHVLALNNLAWFSKEEKSAEALSLAKRAYDLAPNSPVVLHTYGSVLAKTGDALESRNVFRKYATARFREAKIATERKDSSADIANALQGLLQYDFPEKPDAEALLKKLRSEKTP